MANTSQKRKNKRAWTGGIIALVALLIIAFIVSNQDKNIDPASFANVETFDDSAHELGNEESDIRLIEYSDFQCPACKAAEPTIKGLVETFGDQMVFEYRHFPLSSIHPNATLAAQASEAAAIQGKFWEMHNALFEHQDAWAQSFNPEKYFIEYAKEIGLNVDRFRYDLDSQEVEDRVNADAQEAQSLQLPGTPSFVYNGEIVELNDFINTHLDLSKVSVPETAEETSEATTQ